MPIARGHAHERIATKLLTGVGSLLVVGSFAVDYHLWDSLGDRHLPTVGPLFVVPAVVGVVLAVAADTFRKPQLVAAEPGFARTSAGPERAILVRPS